MIYRLRQTKSWLLRELVPEVEVPELIPASGCWVVSFLSNVSKCSRGVSIPSIHSAAHSLLCFTACVYLISLLALQLFDFTQRSASMLFLFPGLPSIMFSGWSLTEWLRLKTVVFQLIYKTFLNPNVYLLIGCDKSINSHFVKVIWHNKTIGLRVGERLIKKKLKQWKVGLVNLPKNVQLITM